MTDLVVVVILAAVCGAAVRYIYKAKKSGAKCIGCSAGKSGCGCSCETSGLSGSGEGAVCCRCHTDSESCIF